MNRLVIEKRNKEVRLRMDTISYISRSANTKQEAVNRLREILSDKIQIGFGGSHVWMSNSKNERVAIIYFSS